MKNVVYILGAGFSAPLGLPLMSDFLEKAKNMISADEVKYGHFDGLIDRVNKTSLAMNIFEYERFNIEEALSILDFSEKPGMMSNLKKEFVRFIIDVIKYYTHRPFTLLPEGRIYDQLPDYPDIWTTDPFQDMSSSWKSYVGFVGGIQKLELYDEMVDFNGRQLRAINLRKSEHTSVSYSVITLNYDIDSVNRAKKLPSLNSTLKTTLWRAKAARY
jgi:hypothetical protein